MPVYASAFSILQNYININNYYLNYTIVHSNFINQTEIIY